MVDYSGVAVNTFDMTKGLFDAYSKAASERQAREKTAQEMEQKAYDFDQRKKVADQIENRQANANTAAAGLLRSNFPAQSMDALKLAPEIWQRLGTPPVNGSQQMVPQSTVPRQMPLPPPRPQGGAIPQGNMPIRTDFPFQSNPMTGGLSQEQLNQVRFMNKDRSGRFYG